MPPTGELPVFSDIEAALLQYLADYGPVAPKDVFGSLGDQFGLTAEQRALEITAGGRPLWNNRVSWARQSLKNKGLLSPRLRVWELSELGMQTAGRR